AVPATVVLLIAVVQQRGELGIGRKPDRCAVASVASRRPPLLDELLAPEGDRAVPAISGLDVDPDLVDELHGAFCLWEPPLGGGVGTFSGSKRGPAPSWSGP